MTRSEGSSGALLVYAVVAFALFALIGAYVSSRTPTRIDVEAVALRGVGVPVAAWFTQVGYWPALSVFGAIAILGTYVAGSRNWLVPALVGSHALSQTVIAGVKLLFHRTRPDYWLIHQEVDTSYPSGHAATAMTFYLALILLAWNAPLPRAAQFAATVVLGACVVAIPWSRLALGAHYLSDVIGGTLFGSAWLALSIALVLRYAR